MLVLRCDCLISYFTAIYRYNIYSVPNKEQNPESDDEFVAVLRTQAKEGYRVS
jgi:hypothetical protein